MFLGNRGAERARICIRAIAQRRATTPICIRDGTRPENSSENGLERRRLSARIAANDVTGLTDSLRGGLHIERVGRQHGANSLAISIHSRILAHRNERTYREKDRDRERGTERVEARERERERVNGRTLTDYYTSNMDLRGGRHNGATNAQPPRRTAVLRTPPGKLRTPAIQYWP